ncbi:MAG: NAD-dependent epimerase/dehydratase family protein, partial [Pyrinomonadaceae bacterium]
MCLLPAGRGFIGSHLVDALVARGHRVRVLDLLIPQVHSAGAPQYINSEAEFIQGDVCDAGIVQREYVTERKWP